MQAKNPVGYFEIPVTDFERAILFYEHVFDCKLQRTVIDGNEMALFPFDDKLPDITGALAKGGSYIPSKQGARLYFNVRSIDEALQRAEGAGGRTLDPKTSIG